MEEFKKIEDLKKYVYDCLINGAKPKKYAKFGTIHAVQGKVGQEVKTVLKNGLTETVNVVKADENGNADWIVTNPSGEKYIVTNKNMNKRYESVDEEHNIYRPKLLVQEFIQANEDISFKVSWGEMNLKKGGYLNITNENDIYGIAKEEFAETYAECDKHGVFKDFRLNLVDEKLLHE